MATQQQKQQQGGPIPPVTDRNDLPDLPAFAEEGDIPTGTTPESEDYSSYLRLWSALRFIFRDACLEGETEGLQEQVKRLTDYELSVMRAGIQILYVMSLDEHIKRGLA